MGLPCSELESQTRSEHACLTLPRPSRFMPLMRSSGSLMLDGQVVDVAGEATFIHAIQGMRPNNIASRWNFCYFTTGGGQAAGELGTVRAVQMEFETTVGVERAFMWMRAS